MTDRRDRSFDATALGPRALVPGEVFAGRYEVLAPIGAGGMGAVYRVRDRTLGEVVALKVLTLGGPGETVAVERFRREVRVARKVTHRNVCRTFDVGEEAGVHYLTMECVEGRALDDVLAETRRLPLARALEISIEVCEGLAAAHEAGIVHRDLKPANVIIEKSGRVVLTDFGIARPIGVDGDPQRTQGSIGTPTYMAPEQVHGEAVDARSDLYAFGVMLYEMLTGEVPFEGPTPMAAAVARLLQEPPDPRTKVPMPDAAADLVLRCLSRDRTGRPASAAEVRERLREISGTRTSSTAIGTTTTPKPRAPTLTGDRALGVLPFKYRGPPDHEYLGQGLTDELIDTLSRTRGIKVLASGATARFADERDPRTVGQALGVDAIVDGSVTRSGERVRITARLVDVATGVQAWSEKFEGAVEDVLALEENMGRRIAEALRLEIGAGRLESDVPAEALALYFQGRRSLRGFRVFGPDGAVGLLERALEIAPGLRAAVAARAVASVRAWFLPGIDTSRDWTVAAREAVADALARADDLAETHLAAGMLAVQRGEYPSAVASLRRALEIAPTFPEAHEYLGNLQCEAGPADEGIRRLRLAFDLDPNLSDALSSIARYHALRGDIDGYERMLAELRKHVPPGAVPLMQMEVRVGTWLGDTDRIRRAIETIREDSSPPAIYLKVGARYVLGRLSAEEVEVEFAKFLSRIPSPRFASAVSQFMIEAHCSRDRPDLALPHLLRAASSVLIDLEWLDRCPVLPSLRLLPAFADVRRQVALRAEALWRA